MVNTSLLTNPEFLSAHAAHEQQQRINTGKIGALLVVFLMPPGVLLDWFVYREQVWPFLWIRLLGSAMGLALWFLHTTKWGQDHVRWLGLPTPLAPAFCISWMIFRTEGAGSSYYAGLNLVLLAVSVVLRWNFIESLLLVGGVTVMYVLACVAQSGGSFYVNPAQMTALVNNLYFLTLTGVIVVTGNTFFNRLRFREFCLAYELEKNKQQLEESNRKLTELDQIKGRFFANISHELRTPLTLMISPLETILARYRSALDDNAVSLLQTMQSNGLRLLKLINDLLDLVRLDSGVMHVKREPVALHEFLRNLSAAARQVAEDKQIALTVSAPDLGLVMVDRDKLEKIVLNLQFNALKFTPAKGRVDLHLEHAGEQIVLKVSDTGIGIPKDKLPQMFQRFMQVDTSSRRKYQGVGIGLALVKELVEVQGGQVSVDSVEGEGSTFTVHLPYIAAPAGAVAVPAAEIHATTPFQPAGENTNAAAAGGTVGNQEWLTNLYHRANLFSGTVGERRAVPVSSDSKAGLHERTVLIADDQPDMLGFLKSELSRHYNVIEASDGQQAVDKAAANTPDIILLDMMMPEKDGIQAAREIRGMPSTQNTPIILITAHVDEETKVSALRAGASDFLPKPFSTTELHVRVKNLVDSNNFQRRLADQNAKLAETIELLKDTEMQLVQTEKIVSLGRMSAGLIHEINNPLNFAATSLYTLRQQGEKLAREKPAEFSEVLGDINDGLQRVKNIVSDLRSFTHPEAEQREMVVLAEAVSTSLRLLNSEWRDRVQIEQALPPDLICFANKNKLMQVFVNLIQNSLDALKQKAGQPGAPVIRISGRRERDRIVLSVFDNGEGIEPENLSRIFDPFFTTREVGHGMGMGLSICYRIVKELGGTISAKSTRGEFCEMTIELRPAEESAEAAA